MQSSTQPTPIGRALTAEELKQRSEQAKLRHKQRMQARTEAAALLKQSEPEDCDSNRRRVKPASRNTGAKSRLPSADLNQQETSSLETAPQSILASTTIASSDGSSSPAPITDVSCSAPVTTMESTVTQGGADDVESSSRLHSYSLPTPIAPTPVEEDSEVFIAFARVFSGRLTKGQKLLVLTPKYDPLATINKVSAFNFGL